MIYRCIFDNGKPYELFFDGNEALEKGLKDFWLNNKDGDYPFTAEVYLGENEITESQFICEMVMNFMEKI